MNACLHTQTQKPGKREKKKPHKALSALMLALTKTVPMEKKKKKKAKRFKNLLPGEK